MQAIRALAGSTDTGPARTGRMLDMLDMSSPQALAGALEEIIAAAPQAELGSAARLISRLVASATPASPISSALPLAASAGDAPRIAAGLQDAVHTSGLFYESHLADWVAGAGSRAQLLREPQAALAAMSSHADPQPAEVSGSTARLTPQAEVLVQRQLDVLERHATLWQGQVWPGQDAELRIGEEERNARAGGEPGWQAALKLAFPGLGRVEAQIGLHGTRVRLELRAGDGGAVLRLQAERGELARALDEHGLVLANAKVSHAGRE